MSTAAELKSFLIEEGQSYYGQLSLAEKCALLEKISDLEKDDSLLSVFGAEVAKNILLTQGRKNS